MATSPYFTTSNPYILYDIHVDEISTDINSNSSTIRVWVIAWRTNQGYQTYGSGYCIVNINGEEYFDDITPAQVIDYESDTLMFDRTVTIPHDADGKKTIYVSAYFDHTRFSSNSQGFNVTLTAIPRQANLTGAPNFNDTQSPTITYSNPAGNAVTSLQACISLTGSSADIAYRDIPKNATSYTFNLTQAEKNVLLASIPNANSRSVVFIVKTVIGGVTYYSNLTRTFSVVNANPTISGPSYYDTNSATIAITNNDQKIIQKASNVSFKVNTISSLKYATLSSVRVTCNGVTKSATLSGSTTNNVIIAFGAIDSTSNLSASIVVTDSRGNTASATLNITMLEWNLPTANISLSRKSNYYSETYLTVNANISSLDGNNTVTIKYQYKEKDAGSYGSLVTINNGQTYTLNLDNEKSYDFKIFVTDRVGETIYNKVLQIGIPILYIDRLLRSVGIGTIPSETNMLAVDRRLSLKNTLQETVADLWSTVTTEANRSAHFRLYNSAGDIMSQLTGYAGGGLNLYNTSAKLEVEIKAGVGNGYFNLKNSSENSIVTLGISASNGGYIGAKDANGNARGVLSVGTYGGALNLYKNDNTNIISIFANSNGGGAIVAKNTSGNTCAEVYCGNNNAGYMQIYNSSSTRTILLAGESGNITCVSLTQTSSRKVKKNIEGLTTEEAYKVLLLTAVTFDYKDANLGKDRRGFIAEDVAEVIPQVVAPETEDAPASIDYIQLIPYLQTVIKEQEKKLTEQEQKIKDLEKRLEDLESKIK